MSSYLSNKYCSCLNFSVPECVEYIHILTDELNEELIVEIVDKFYIVRRQEVLTDNNGEFVLDLTLFKPIGNRYSGDYTITSYIKGTSRNEPIYFPTDKGAFLCLSFNFETIISVDTTYPYNTDTSHYYVPYMTFECCCNSLPINCS